MRSPSPIRRLAVAAGLLVAVLVACGREAGGPSAPTVVNAFHRVGTVRFAPQFETAIPAGPELRAALLAVAFTKVHVTLRREDGTIALEQDIDFPSDATELTVSLNVSLPANAPASGVPLQLSLDYTNAAGTSVFKGGPVTVNVTPNNPGSPTPQPTPVVVPVTYSGPGAEATRVTITPKLVNGTVGQSINFSAVASTTAGVPVVGAPIVFSTSNAAVVTVDANTGTANFVGRGSASVTAQLLTGPSDAASVTVIRPATQIVLVSGNNQTAPVGAALPQPIVARVQASDGVGVAGVTVNFSAAGGGLATPPSAVSGADGSVSTSWKMGPTAGPQTLSISSGSLTGTSVNATAQSLTPTKLAIVTGPLSGKAGTALGAISVAAQDASSNTVAAFTGDVSVAIGTNPAGGTLSGSTTVKAVNGVANFGDLKIDKPGTGYTLTFSSSGLTSQTSGAFNIVAGDAAKLVFGAMPSSADAGSAIAPITVTAQDASGNTVTSFASPVTIAIATGPSGATITGTLTKTAVAGVATFSDLVITKRGIGYQLSAASTGLASGTSSGFTIVAGPPTTVAFTSGAGQTAPVSTVLAPIALQVRDAFGNGIGSKTVTLAATLGGGSVAPASVTTDADGNASFVWTLGSLVGLQTVTASVSGSSLSASVSATGTAGAAAKLAITTAPGATLTAGLALAPTIVVQAQDAGGAPQTGFAGLVTASVASGPAGGTVSGTATATASAGSASFNNLRLRKAGVYTITFSAPGLSSVTTASITVNPAPAQSMVVAGGTGQSGNAGATLATPFSVFVTDSTGNPVSGTSVTWAVTAGGGSLTAINTSTDAAGLAATTLTLGAVAGTNTVTATSAGLTGSPLTFNATGNVGAATHLYLARDLNTALTAGKFDTVVVWVKDAANNVVTSSSATVTLSIATGPAGGTIIGPVSVAAASGVASFFGIAFDKKGSYTLTVASAGLTGATTSTSVVTAGWPKFLAADSGQGQTGSTGQPLTNNIVARLTDQYGNATAGRTVNWGVPTLAGSLSNTTATTDTGGRVYAKWQLGATAGAQSVTATAADTGVTTSVVTFNATANLVTYDKLWIGTTDTNWGTATNWSPSGVPIATDRVSIGAAANQPTLSSSTTVATLQVQNSATLTLSGGGTYLTVNGAVNEQASGAITGSGVLSLAGATGTIVGPTFPYTVITGVYSLSGVTGFTSSVEVNSGGSLNANGFAANLTGSLIVNGTGTLLTSGAGSAFNVGGNVTFGGGNIALSAGTLQIGGNFTQTGASTFKLSGSLATTFTGVVNKTITIADTSANSYFNTITNTGSGTITLASPLRALGTYTASVGAGNITGAGKALRVMGVNVAAAAQMGVDTLNIWRTGSGPYNVPITSGLTTTLVVNSDNALLNAGPLSLTGNLGITENGLFDINGQTVTLSGSLFTGGSGRLKMTAGQLNVGGNATFSGGSTTGQLTGGVLAIAGNFNQTAATSTSAFDASNTHRVEFVGATNHTLTLSSPAASRFADLKNTGSGTLTLQNDVIALGLTSVGSGAGVVSAPGHKLSSGKGVADAGFGLKFSADTVELAATGTFQMPDTLFAVLNVGTGITATVGNAFKARLGLRVLGALQMNGQSVTVNGPFSTLGSGTLLMNNADHLYVNGNITFNGGDETGLLGNGFIHARGNFAQLNAGTGGAKSFHAGAGFTVKFDSATTNGVAHVVSLADPDTSLTTSCAAAFSCFGNLIVNHNTSNAPVQFTSHFKAAGYVDFTGSGIDNITTPASSLFIVGNQWNSGCCTSRHFNRLALGGVYSYGGVSGVAIDTLIFFGTGQQFEPLGNAMGAAAVRISGTVKTPTGNQSFTGPVTVDGAGAELTIGAPTGTLYIDGPFKTLNGGALKMTDASNILTVTGAMTFAGGSTAGLLTKGKILPLGDFTVGGVGASAQAFSADSTLETSFEGTVDQVVRVFNGGWAGNKFGELYHGSSHKLLLRTNVYAETFETGISANHQTVRDTSFYPVIISRGADVRNVAFDGVKWAIIDGNTVTDLDAVSFANLPDTTKQFAIARTGGGATGSIVALTGAWSFSGVPSTGLYLDANDTAPADGNVLAVNFTGTVSPAAHGGSISLAGGATTNWPAGFLLTATMSGDWSDPNVWSPAKVPGINDDVYIGEANITLTGNASVKTLTLNAGDVQLGTHSLAVYGNVSGPNGAVYGTGQLLMAATGAQTLELAQGNNLAVAPGSVVALAGNSYFYGDVTIAGKLVLGGKSMTVEGTTTTSGTGGVKMVNALDSLSVYDVVFAGAASDTLLTAGTLVVYNSITQAGDPKAFAPTGTHVTVLKQSWIGGALRAGVRAPTALSPRLRSLAEESAVLRNRRRAVIGAATFANPGWSASHFNILQFDHTNDQDVVFNSDVYASNAQTVGMTSMRGVHSSLQRRLFVKDATLFQLSFNRIALQVDAGGTAVALDTLVFYSQDPTINQLALNLSNSLTMKNMYFDVPPTTGKYLNVIGTGGPVVTMVNPFPGSHGGFVGTTNATISGWNSSVAYSTAAGGQWQTPATWSPVGVPSRYDDVTINGGTVDLNGDVGVRNLTMAAGAALNLGYSNIHVQGNWDADTTASISAPAAWSRVYFEGANKTIKGKLFHTTIYSPMSLAGRTIAAGKFSIISPSASLNVGSNFLTVTSDFLTDSGATLQMGSGSSQLEVGGNARFFGGIHTGLLTNGKISLNQNFEAIDKGFDASGSLLVAFNGTPGQNISWTGLGPYGAFQHLRFANSGVKSIDTRISVKGNINIASDVSNDIGGHAMVTWIGAAMRDSSGAPNGRWAVDTLKIGGAANVFPAQMKGQLNVVGTLTLNDSLRVTGDAQVSGYLVLNGHRAQVQSLDVNNAGVVQMTAAGNTDTLIVNGPASWHGDTPNLTKGVTIFNGSFEQLFGDLGATTTFIASGTHQTRFMRASPIDSTLTFDDPSSNKFNDLVLESNILLNSDVTVGGTLSKTTLPLSAIVRSTGINTLTASGFDNPTGYLITFNRTRFKLVDGTANVNTNGLSFTNFTSFGGFVFEVNRSTPDPLTTISAQFSGVSLSGGYFIKNTGTATLNPLSGVGCASLAPGQGCTLLP